MGYDATAEVLDLFGNQENVHGNRGSLSDVRLESEQPKSGWHSYLPEDHDTFVKLPWYLVADAVLVKRVMMRAVARLESTPFEASDVLLTNNQARLSDLLHGSFSKFRFLHYCSDCYRVERTSSRVGPAAIADQHLSRRSDVRLNERSDPKLLVVSRLCFYGLRVGSRSPLTRLLATVTLFSKLRVLSLPSLWTCRSGMRCRRSESCICLSSPVR
jgi:hypothetical protein